jgi:hypothetical protein
MVEAAPARWFYLLESAFIENPMDWRENADCYGPFPSEVSASDHLNATHANPGGYGIASFRNPADADTITKIERAVATTKHEG